MIMPCSPGSDPIGMEQQVMQPAVVKLETTDLKPQKLISH